jgi:hypothetical protein
MPSQPDETGGQTTSPPKPHVVNVVAWDIPSAIVVGEKFRMKIGIKCADECDLANMDFGIYDEQGTQVATGALPAERWPGTSGLHVREVELEAPAAEGLYMWSVRSPSTTLGASLAADGEIAHAEESVSFGVRVVGRPEYLVTVEAVDQSDQAPLSGARVVMHPYRAVTDERGIAKVRVAKGAYQLFVSQTRYVTFGLPVEVQGDMTARAELSVEPVTERN